MKVIGINMRIKLSMSKFDLKPFHKDVSDEDLLNDIRSVASYLGKVSITGYEYDDNGEFSLSTIEKRFGWNNALDKAGLAKTRQRDMSDDELFENLEEVWMKLGRQPTRTDMHKPLSKHGVKPYVRRFGSWRMALETFVNIANADPNGDNDVQPEITEELKTTGRKTPREPNWKLRYQVLARDGAKCRLCGKSSNEVKLHV